MLRGEIEIKIRNIQLTQFKEEDNYDMTIYDEDGGFLHICGDNNLPKLFQDATDNIVKFQPK